jgi:hypothetical protein
MLKTQISRKDNNLQLGEFQYSGHNPLKSIIDTSTDIRSVRRDNPLEYSQHPELFD